MRGKLYRKYIRYKTMIGYLYRELSANIDLPISLDIDPRPRNSHPIETHIDFEADFDFSMSSSFGSADSVPYHASLEFPVSSEIDLYKPKLAECDPIDISMEFPAQTEIGYKFGAYRLAEIRDYRTTTLLSMSQKTLEQLILIKTI